MSVCLLWLAMLSSMLMAQDAAQPLAATDVTSAYVYSVYDPLYGRPRPAVEMGRNAAGGPLVLDGKTYPSGLGGRLFSIVELAIPAGFGAIRATVGIDDRQSQASGDTYFSLWADGRELWRSPAVAAADPAIEVTVPLSGARQVKLLTDAQGYSNADLADWCDVAWLQQSQGDAPTWHWLRGASVPTARLETHPYHLLYAGEDLRLTVVGSEAGEVTLQVRVLDGDGRTVLDETQQVVLERSDTGACVAAVTLPSHHLQNGLYHGIAQVSQPGLPSSERPLRFGILGSPLGRPVSGTIYGVNHHEFVSSYEALAAAGAEYSRQWFCWDWIEHEKGHWSFDWHDERMAAARVSGIKTIGVLGGIGCPAWTSPGNVEPGQTTTHGYPADLAEWEHYVRTVATRYRGQVRVWESWNEVAGLAEQGRLGWSIPKYVQLHRLTYDVLKQIDPESLVLVCADSLQFVGRCLEAGLGDAFDGIVIHPYRPGAAPEQGIGNAQVGNVGDVSSVFGASAAWLRERGHGSATVWGTEIGWALTGQDWPVVSEELHGQYVPRTYLPAQASGAAANVCWHDFGHAMFGLCDGRGYPRPALLSFAAMVSRLEGARPLRRSSPGDDLHTALLAGYDTMVLALWAAKGHSFARLSAPAEIGAAVYDWFGNRSELRVPAAGCVVPVSSRMTYITGPQALADVAVSQVQPFTLGPAEARVRAGGETELALRLSNVFARDLSFPVTAQAPEGLTVSLPQETVLQPDQEVEAVVRVAADRAASPGLREVVLTVGAPGGARVDLRARVRVTSPLAASVEPFDARAAQTEPVRVRATVRNDDERPVEGTVEFSVPEGFTLAPQEVSLPLLGPGATASLSAELRARRPAGPEDSLRIVVTTSDGARVELSRLLAPTIVDADGNGLADGWRINPETHGDEPEGNLARVSIEPGGAEFFCQRIDCPRFRSGWIILHRDGKDAIRKDTTYRIGFSARQEGIEGTVGVAVYNISPWHTCGIERQFRVGPEWEPFTAQFTATRDSDMARFEFYFTETGTLWLEGLRLEAIEADD